MQRAGTELANLIQSINPQNLTVFLCGPGNNGADGLVAASLLASQSLPVIVSSPFPAPNPQSLFPKALRRAESENLTVEWNFPPADLETLRPGIWVDALLGIGQSRPLQGPLLETVQFLQNRVSPILAVDCPTGLDGASGKRRTIAVPATHTLTFFAPKQGFFATDGPRHCGKVTVSHLGTDPAAFRSWLTAYRRR